MVASFTYRRSGIAIQDQGAASKVKQEEELAEAASAVRISTEDTDMSVECTLDNF